MSELQDPNTNSIAQDMGNLSIQDGPGQQFRNDTRTRGEKSEPIASAEAPPPAVEPRPEDLEYVRKAIKDGDKLGRSEKPDQATRRALIVAPLYYDYDMLEELKALGSMIEPVRDARLMHQILRQNEYQAENIRILTDGFDHEYFGATHPTRENILSSLDWLVHGARSTDYRFFHFAGHGQRFPSGPGQGKKARKVVPADCAPVGDTELWAKTHDKSGVGRKLQQMVEEADLVYYEEAILTRTSFDPKDRGKILNRVTDKELNRKFAELPVGCRLTCVMDCCASGRIINNGIKLLGDGFRGRVNYNITLGGPPSKIGQPTALHPGILVRDLNLFGFWGLQQQPNPQPITEGSRQNDPQEQGARQQNNPEEQAASEQATPQAQEVAKPSDLQQENVFNTAVTMYEGLPDDEMALDQIRAEASTWAACHQRQLAAHSYRTRCGLLTQAFTEALGHSEALKVQDLYNAVSRRVREASYLDSFNAQDVQVRVSTHDKSEENLKDILDSKVVI